MGIALCGQEANIVTVPSQRIRAKPAPVARTLRLFPSSQSPVASVLRFMNCRIPSPKMRIALSYLTIGGRRDQLGLAGLFERIVRDTLRVALAVV